MSRDELIRGARDLVPTLRARAGEAEKLRRLPSETIADFRALGLFRIMAPARYGGLQMSLGTLAACVVEVSRGCGSSGWCLCILGVHNWLAGLFEDKAQDELFAGSDHVLFAATFSGSGVAAPVDGGFRVRGRWGFASGVDFGTWVAVAARVPSADEAAAPDVRNVLLPIGDVEVVDTWFVAGLKGTGSKDIAIHDAFVPAHRTLSFRDVAEGTAPGIALHHGAGIYRLPMYTALTLVATAPAVGIALGALDDYVALTRERIPYGGGSKYAERPTLHARLGRAAALTDSARLLLQRGLDAVDARTHAVGAVSPEERIGIRRDCAHAVALCVEAVDLLVGTAGAKAQYDRSPLQRAQRDLHTLRTHVVFDLDGAMELYGRMMLGLPPNSIFF